MSSIVRHFRRPLIALAAVVAALSAAGEASACSTMKRADSACAAATSCGCCTTGAAESTASRSVGLSPAAVPAAPSTCEATPGGGCGCRSQDPAAPAPRPPQGPSGHRTEPGHGPAFAHLACDLSAPFQGASAIVPAHPSPPRTPLYLRNERLLF